MLVIIIVVIAIMKNIWYKHVICVNEQL